MSILTVTLFTALIAAVAVAVILFWPPARTTEHLPAVGTSPLDHAERILASRYARREITSDEYQRMLTVLRR